VHHTCEHGTCCGSFCSCISQSRSNSGGRCFRVE
ncbi:glycosyl hydrolases 18 family protein, partial [Vibrio cholerae CP1035(8)]